MKTEIQTYIPKHDLLGRFKTTKITKNRIIIVLLLLTIGQSYLVFKLAKQAYNWQCSNGVRLISKARCDELVRYQVDAQELYRVQMVQSNQDLFTN